MQLLARCNKKDVADDLQHTDAIDNEQVTEQQQPIHSTCTEKYEVRIQTTVDQQEKNLDLPQEEAHELDNKDAGIQMRYEDLPAEANNYGFAQKGYDCAKMQLLARCNKKDVADDLQHTDAIDKEQVTEQQQPIHSICTEKYEVRIQTTVGQEEENLGLPQEEAHELDNRDAGIQMRYEDLPAEANNYGPLEVEHDAVDHDEVSWFRRMHVLTPIEALYRDLACLMHRLSHTVIRLSVHLPWMYTVRARQVEKYCLRMLLKYMKGPQSFEDVRTVDNRVYSTFFDACKALGMAVDEDIWEASLAEAKAQQLENRALSHIQRMLRAGGQELGAYGIICVESTDESSQGSPSAEDHRSQLPIIYDQLSAGQKLVADTVMSAIYDGYALEQRCFFVGAAGGTGKMFMYNLLLHLVRSRGDVAVAVVFTGIAATLLLSGTTVHSSFKLPLKLYHNGASSISADSKDAEYLRSARLIIWDEAATQERYALEAVDRLLRDVFASSHQNLPFGGHVMLFGGDWKQMLPFVEDTTKEDAMATTVRRSEVWPSFNILRLTENMRAGEGEQEFAAFMNAVGNGQLQDSRTGSLYVKMLRRCFMDLKEDVVEWIYDSDALQHGQAIIGRALLSVRNDDFSWLNDLVLKKIRPEEDARTYFAVDEIYADDPKCVVEMMAHEYLNFTTSFGMPPYQLVLKRGAVVMLLRNIDLQAGLCNGTRMIVDEMRPNTLLCTILIGTHAGKRVVLTKLSIKWKNRY
uniref:ATP-dependent DNA helicase n=1 Tax=Ascaris lumbricoides TaxID=6252 RepID=A0A0M3IDC4_ASCLU